MIKKVFRANRGRWNGGAQKYPWEFRFPLGKLDERLDEGGVFNDDIADTVSVAPIYLLSDDPYYELMMFNYDCV